MDIILYNSKAWDKQADQHNECILPVSKEVIAQARLNKAPILLTNSKYVPSDWYMPIHGKKVLCLACGGRQQAPIFAAMGANITVIDNSYKQLENDLFVAQRDNLVITTIHGNMKDLSLFVNNIFDMIFHPISNCFIDNPHPVWQECCRILKKGKTLLSGFNNPLLYIFDLKYWEKQNILKIKNIIPYSDVEQLTKNELEQRIKNNDTLEYGHSLETQIQGQLKVDFLLTSFYEDISKNELIDKHINTSIATKAIKL